MSRSTTRRQSLAIALSLLLAGAVLGSPSRAHAAGGGNDGGDSLLSAPTPVDFGRVLQGQATSKSVSLSNSGMDTGATFSNAPANSGITVTTDGTIGANTSENLTFNLQTNSNGSGSTGSKSIGVTITNTSMGGDMAMGMSPATGNEQDPFNITALVTVVANRDLTGGATAALGRVMVNANTASVNTTINGGSADDNNATRVNVNNGSASSGGVTVTRTGGTQLIDSANESATVGVVGNFSTTGAKSGSVNASSLLTNGETSITGTPTVDSTVNVGYTATAVANRDLTADSAALGRVMINANTASVNVNVNGGSADDNNATRVNLNNGSTSSGGVTVTRTGGTNLFDTANETAQVGVVGNFSTTGAKSGSVNIGGTALITNGETAISGTVTVDGTINVGYTATAVNNRDLTAGTAALGRVMINQNSASVTTSVNGGAVDDNNATRVNLNNGSVSNSGVTVTRTGGTNTFDTANETANVGVVGNFSTVGVKSGSVNIGGTSLITNGETAISGSVTVDSTVNVGYTATAVDNRSISSTAVNLGRVMINQTHTATTTFSSSAIDNNATRVTLGSGNRVINEMTILGSAAPDFTYPTPTAAPSNVTRNAQFNFSTAGLKSDSGSFTPNGEGLTGEAVQSISASYTATALANRNLDQQGGPVNLGNVLVGANSATQVATITGGVADDDHQTRVTLGNGSVTQNGVTVSGGAAKLFNGANQTTTRNVVGNFSSSGAKSGVVNLAGQLSNSESALMGTVSLDNTINVAYTANAYDAAALSGNAGSTLGNNGTVSMANASGSFRSAAYVDSVSVTGGWTVSNLSPGTVINAGGNTNTAKASIDDSGYLNGFVLTGTLSVTLENDQSLTGAANQDLGTLNWNLAQTVVGESGVQMAPVGVGGSYANLYGTSDQGLGTNASFLGGTNSNGPATTLETSWRARASGELPPYNMTNPLVSDVVSVHGSDGDTFVLELTYSESQLSDFESNLAPLGLLYLAWFDGADWVNAIEGNSGSNTTNVAYLNYQGSWLASGAGLTLGAWGVDVVANRVWAVINHNSDFSVLNEPENFDNLAVPEPSTGLAALLGLASCFAIRRYRRKRAK